MATKQPTEIERLTRLVDAKLSDMERRAEAGELPSIGELNGARRLGVRTPARIYDLRSTFASDALAAGVSVFQLARIMGTSVRMIERHYGTMLDGSGTEIATALEGQARRHPQDGTRDPDSTTRAPGAPTLRAVDPTAISTI